MTWTGTSIVLVRDEKKDIQSDMADGCPSMKYGNVSAEGEADSVARMAEGDFAAGRAVVITRHRTRVHR